MSYHFELDKKLSFSVLENGKPYLLSTNKYHFSFSHTHDFILCGISSFSPVGVDVERKMTASLDIMRIIFHSFEIQYIQNYFHYLLIGKKYNINCFYIVKLSGDSRVSGQA